MKNIYIDINLLFHLLNYNPSATEPTSNKKQQLEGPPLKRSNFQVKATDSHCLEVFIEKVEQSNFSQLILTKGFFTI